MFLRGCLSCDFKTDLFCVSCKNWFCEEHLNHCVVCEEAVCDNCYLEDLCCLTRPFGGKSKRHLKDLYQSCNVLDVDVNVACCLNYYAPPERLEWAAPLRKKAVERAVKYYVDEGGMSFKHWSRHFVDTFRLIGQYFPLIPSEEKEREKIRFFFRFDFFFIVKHL